MSRRTMFRDLKSLQEAGVPVVFDNDTQRYRIDAAHFLPPTNLTLEEALSLLVIVGQARGAKGAPLLASAGGAADKIEASLPAPMRSKLRELTAAISARGPSRNQLDDKHSVYNQLLAARVNHRSVRITYNCLTDGDRLVTEFHPYHLLFHTRSWYAIGRSVEHGDVRTFNLGRIVAADPLDEPFKVPRSFSITKYLGNAWGLIPETGPDQLVRLRFSPLVARNVSEVLWHPKQQCRIDPDGSLDYRVTVSGLREIVWWILGYGDQVEVIAPQRLRKMVAHRLTLAAKHYPDVT